MLKTTKVYFVFSLHVHLGVAGAVLRGPQSGTQADGAGAIWNGDGSSGRKKENMTNCEAAHRVRHLEMTCVTSTHFSLASKTHMASLGGGGWSAILSSFRKGESKNTGGQP